MASGAFIEARELTRVYSLGKVRVRALNGIEFSLREGRFAAVVGSSGSGKSTFLNLVGGLDSPTSGKIRVAGALISEMNRNDLAAYRREEVGMVFQSFNLIPSRTALENVELPLIFSGRPRKARRQRALELLEKVGLGNRSGHRPAELSGGEQQRVAVARALANEPRVLLADEPTGNLDSATSLEVVGLLADLNRRRNLTVVLVSHEENLVREFAHEIVRLRDGEVVEREILG